MTPLRQRMLEDMQVRNLFPLTQRSYVEPVARFARHFSQSPAVLGPEEIRAYQVYLVTDKQLAPATIVIAVAALRFLYAVTLQKAWTVEVVIPTSMFVSTHARCGCVVPYWARAGLASCRSSRTKISVRRGLSQVAVEGDRVQLEGQVTLLRRGSRRQLT